MLIEFGAKGRSSAKPRAGEIAINRRKLDHAVPYRYLLLHKPSGVLNHFTASGHINARKPNAEQMAYVSRQYTSLIANSYDEDHHILGFIFYV
jgi:16S rRNA U516 pseudouridylate synthase RsuA-like enzyme